MEKLQIDKSQLSTPTSTATTPTSRPSSRRTSTIIPRDSLPTPPPDPRCSSQSDNFFIYPPTEKDLPSELHGLLRYAERQEEYQQTLQKKIASDCRNLHQNPGEDSSNTGQDDKQHKCTYCDKVRKECCEFMEPLQFRLNGAVTAALAAYGAIEQLNHLYSMWEQYITKEREMRERKECLRYIKLLEKKAAESLKGATEKSQDLAGTPLTDNEIDPQDMEKSIALLETILSPELLARYKSHDYKLQRERSKSFIIEDMPSLKADREASKSHVGIPHLLRRQSTYCDSKSKVSKWTKVKAAFKWEKANVPIMYETHKDGAHIGLQPNNTEVARYLRVPSAPCGNSSADSILSSSSGHLLSETGTPGTISSASSIDDIDNTSGCGVSGGGGGLSNMRRDSSKSETLETQTEKSMPQSTVQESKSADTLNVDDSKYTMPPKSSSSKSIRRSKLVSDFEVVPEDVEAVIKTQAKRKNPPRPLDLNLRQDLNDSENYYMSTHLLKASPQEGTQSLNRALKKVSSPVNSSVPSSPSRHSDFFAEFESEELSSGDFSEPNSPNHLTSRQSFERQQEEINRRYQVLRAKLDEEFESKRKEWEKLKSKKALALVSAPKPPEPLSPSHTTTSMGSNFSAKLLEENLTPDFKKKLQKWRVKKQASIGGIHGAPVSPLSPKETNASCSNVPKDAKIDWNLWKTGQLKLEGQGLKPLPDQKDLPEEFQKKLEEWNKIKRGGSATNCTDSMKRNKQGGLAKKGESDDDRGGGGGSSDKDKRLDKHKHHDKEKSERLAKLKAIVSDHPAKEIEVKTSAGVMKFEGISRKFTRKLYEWEKARGIGPESSTFALLHPGYCPIDVKRISKETHNHENSPTLSRSLSLDSISPSIALPVISQQASSLSLNDVNDLKEMEGVVSSTDALAIDSDYKKYDEPEAVMVEVEDHIVETASPLVMANPIVKKQTPVYKYEEKACKDFCNTRKIQSFESHTNLAPLLNVLKNSEELLKLLKKKSPEIAENTALRFCESTLALIRSSYSYYSSNLMKPNVLNAISDVQNELSRLRVLCEKSPLDEACCQEVMEERNTEYNEEFEGLHETLDILKQNIQGGMPRYSKDIVPDINIITDEGFNSSFVQSSDNNRNDNLSTTLEATDELSTSMVENDTEGMEPVAPTNANATADAVATTTATIRFVATSANGNSNGGSSGGCGTKKKVRLRKMGSRQNSKTESDSSDEDNLNVLETPRRLKRKNYRLKQRSFDEDPSSATIAEEVGECVLKDTETKMTRPMNLPLATSTSLPSVFVKTKRKLFTTVQKPSAIDGLAVIEQEVIHSPTETDGKSPHKSIEEDSGKFQEFQMSQNPRRGTLQREDTLKASDSENLINNLINDIKPRILLVHKSISLEDMRAEMDSEDTKRKSHSMESLKQGDKKWSSKEPRAPLASDSFRKIACSAESTSRLSNISRIQSLLGTAKKKDHLFKKHPEKPFVPHSFVNKGATFKKIESSRIAKTQSSSQVSESAFLSPDKFDNTMPRIARKLERKSLTPTTQHIKFDFPPPNVSEPTTPVFEQYNRPLTPLTQRALRLQKAKEEFLRSKPCPKAVVKLRESVPKTEKWFENRQSDLSLSSTTADESSMRGMHLDHLDSDVQKSLSADTIRAESPPTQSDTGTDQDFGGIYDSLPRQVTRSGKISSKLGFATLASKLRRVKGKKPKEPKRAVATAMGGAVGGSALSALCRQSLFADIIAVPQQLAAGDESKPPYGRPGPLGDNVMKSQSSPHAIFRGAPNEMARLQANTERLNKSQSEQYVKRHKESYV
ncbi:uncharacterized protein LOC106093733 isoform X1 [Stomoxys calcitrans]|uniref:uncharacterized protein LOC106093733 isoform X1 n=1 Tax=Stomoxys calcitrans TaxID=35570 RepID=UPI0027E2A8C3|nr:uncharacterized protein LOC106093733 isoform X1 [Stomoxys calcitrans]XP_013116332.2 uncharacterized protein LOC106093733 isoform X1 [Stomoxys calcitrans]